MPNFNEFLLLRNIQIANMNTEHWTLNAHPPSATLCMNMNISHLLFFSPTMTMFVMNVSRKKKKETKTETYKETSHSQFTLTFCQSTVARHHTIHMRNYLLNNTPNIVSTIIIQPLDHFNLLLLLTDVNLRAFYNKTAISISKLFIRKSFSDWKSVLRNNRWALYQKTWDWNIVYSTVDDIKGQKIRLTACKMFSFDEKLRLSLVLGILIGVAIASPMYYKKMDGDIYEPGK